MNAQTDSIIYIQHHNKAIPSWFCVSHWIAAGQVQKMAPKRDIGVKKIISPGLIYVGVYKKNDVEMYQTYVIFGSFCNTFASLLMEWPKISVMAHFGIAFE